MKEKRGRIAKGLAILTFIHKFVENIAVEWDDHKLSHAIFMPESQIDNLANLIYCEYSVYMARLKSINCL